MRGGETVRQRMQYLLDQPWAITEEAMQAMVRQMDGVSEQQVAAAQAAMLPGERSYTVAGDGVALVPVRGVLGKEADIFSIIFGSSSYASVRADVQDALDDPAVKSILLVVDSPGGVASGADELAGYLRAAAQRKPLYAYADGQMTSAAYWLSTAAAEIAAPPVAFVGSIGVVVMHVDASRAAENEGYRVNFISTGRYKAMGNSYEPLSDEARDYIRERLDGVLSVFLSSVARGRGVDIDRAIEMSGEARVYLAGQAAEAGLIDRVVASLDDYIAVISERNRAMDREELKTKHPVLYAQVMDEGVSQGRAAAAELAAARAADVIGLVAVVAGDEMATKVRALHATGISAEQASALRELLAVSQPPAASDQNSKKQILAALQQAIAKPLHASQRDPAEATTAAPTPDFEALVAEHMRQHNVSRGKALMAMQRMHPAAHADWIEKKQG